PSWIVATPILSRISFAVSSFADARTIVGSDCVIPFRVVLVSNSGEKKECRNKLPVLLSMGGVSPRLNPRNPNFFPSRMYGPLEQFVICLQPDNERTYSRRSCSDTFARGGGFAPSFSSHDSGVL